MRAPHFHSSRRCPAPQYIRILRLSQPLQPFPVAYSLLFPERKMLRFLHRRGKSSLESCSLPSSAHCAWELRSESPKWCYIPSFYQISRKWRGWKRSGHARRTDTTPFVPDRHICILTRPGRGFSVNHVDSSLLGPSLKSTPQFGRSD